MGSEAALAIGAILLFAFFVRGVSGFGSATIAIPLLVHVVPLTLAVPLLLALDFLATLATLRIDRRLVQRSEVAALLPCAVIGVALGASLLIRLPADVLLAALGALVVAFGARTLLDPTGGAPVSRVWAIPAGLSGGMLGGLFGSGAATPYVMYLTRRLRDKRRVRATFSGFALLDYGFRLMVFTATGLLLQPQLLAPLLVGLAAMALGLYLGDRVHHRISNEQALRVIGVVLLGSGAALLWRNAPSLFAG